MGPEEQDPVVVRLRRSHVFGLAGLVLGIGIGIALGVTALAPSPTQTLQLAPGLSTIPGGEASAADPNETVEVTTDDQPSAGPLDAKVTVVEFLDYQCPFCGEFFRTTLPRVRREYGDRVRFVVRDFPLPNLHPYARSAAIAAECAYRLGNFATYHDLLFHHQSALRDADLRHYADEAGIDAAAFAACRDDPATRRAVDKDISDGGRYGVTGTPTFFVNGKRLVGAVPSHTFRAALDGALRDP